MNLKNTNTSVAPKLGEGIFLMPDVAAILQLPYSKVRRWLVEFWNNRFANGHTYSFGDEKNKVINFYTLIEFYTFYQLRLQGVGTTKIEFAHNEISKMLKTPYPFATNIHTDGKNVWYDYIDEVVNANGKQQIDMKVLLDPFLHKIKFGENNLAELFFPLENSKKVVVDPKRQFGQPIITGTSLPIRTIHKLHQGGESKKNISLLYDIKLSEVDDALLYYKRAC